MFSEHPAFKCPSDDTVIWRYLKLKRFQELLDKGELRFPAASSFHETDKWDGLPTRPNMDPRIIADFWFSDVVDENTRIQLATTWRDQFRKTRTPDAFGVSCWSMNDDESHLMWERTQNGIAIKSTVGNLKRALVNHPRKIFIGVVDYVDHETTELPHNNSLHALVWKRKEFKDEREVRAVLQIHDPAEEHLHPFDRKFGVKEEFVPVDLNALIERVVMAPDSDNDAKIHVLESLKRVHLTKDVSISRLSDEPPNEYLFP